MVTMFISSFSAVFFRRSTTPVSFMRLPSIRQAIRGPAEGTSRATNTVTMMGKMIFSRRETSRRGRMTIRRSSAVVRARMMGGWMTGTRAM